MDDSSQRLRQARERAGFISARKAALRFGWNPSTYSSHENGQTPVPKKWAPIYAKAFKIPGGAPYLLYGDKANQQGQPKSRLMELAEKLPVELEPAAADYLEFLMRRPRQPRS